MGSVRERACGRGIELLIRLRTTLRLSHLASSPLLELQTEVPALNLAEFIKVKRPFTEF